MTNHRVSILGCGWLGKALGRCLAESGYRVLGSTTKQENFTRIEESGITPIIFQINELSVENSGHKLFQTDVLIISLPQGIRRGKAQEYLEQISYVTRTSTTCGTRNIILISTTSVYPSLNRVVTEEDADPQNPIVKAEKLVLESGIPSTVVRFAGLFGPGREPGRFLAGKCDVPGGNAPVNMIHLDDCVQIIKNIIDRNVWNTILNACADGHPTRKAFYTKAAVGLGLEPPIFSDEKTDYKIVSNERVKGTLNYKFIHLVM